MPSKKTTKPAVQPLKTSLTFQEQITAAHLHFVQGLDQHMIAFAMSVNPGRVNEACMAVRRGLLQPREAKAAGPSTSPTRKPNGPQTTAAVNAPG